MVSLGLLILSAKYFSLFRSFLNCPFYNFSVVISISFPLNSWLEIIIWFNVSSCMWEILFTSDVFSSNRLVSILLSSSIMIFSFSFFFFWSVTSQINIDWTSCSILIFFTSLVRAPFFFHQIYNYCIKFTWSSICK